jgi:beta-lactam-binding protein with PASTA domain
MGFLSFLTKKKFYINLLIAIALSVVLLWLALWSLDIFTRHGKVYIVPDFNGKTVEQLYDNDYDDFFDLIVIDSVFDQKRPKGSVIQQNPYPGAKVKKGRHVYLTIVAQTPERVFMPDLINLSLRQALVTLETQGLCVGNLEYVEYFARNAVVGQLMNEEPVEPGTELSKGSVVDLQVGKGDVRATVSMPMLIGKPREKVKQELHYAYLNLGNEYFIDVTDSSQARVYKTDPEPFTDDVLQLGQKVDIWYRSDENFNFDEYLKQYLSDTIAADTLQFKNNFE